MKYKKSNLKPFGLLIEANSPEDDLRDLDVEVLRDHFRSEHLIALRGFKPFAGDEEFPQYCERWGEISLWPFGKVLELKERENPEDHIFDNNYVPLHWDGMYRPQVPEYQVFHCVRAPLAGEGGRTTFSNTVLALKHASADTKSLWSKVTGNYQRKMEFYNSETVSQVITRHPHRDFAVIRYNEPPLQQDDSQKDGQENGQENGQKNSDFLNPPKLNFTGVSGEELVEVHRSLKEALYAPENFYAHEWNEGDVVIADNFSLLHGREEFVSQTPRHLRRVHVLSNPPLDNPALVSHK